MVKRDKIIGKHIDHFIVESFIAEGAMGMVFKAHDSTLARVVALKLIPKESQNATDTESLHRAEAKKRLVHEAQTAGKLVHPNIVTIHSYGETDQFQYICMEYIQGKTLSEILKERGAIPVEEAIPIVEQILLALAAAHKAGIVHRDIKPSNIMITEDNRVKVMDFGIAKIPSLSLTVTGMVLGTPFYMSPEQISGKKVDIRSDIFSLGAVFYEMVTGGKPFEAENTATLVYKIVQIDPIPPNIVKVNIPQAVARVISSALAKDAAQRYQKPAEMLRDLKGLASAAPTDSEALIASQPLDITLLADQSQSGAPAIGHISAPHGFPPEQQIDAAGPQGEGMHRREGDREEIQEAQKTKPNMPAIVLLLLLVVCAGGAALWYFNHVPAPVPTPVAPLQSGGVQQVEPPATLPANIPSGVGQPRVPQPGPDTSQPQPSVEDLLLEAEKQFTSNPQGAQKLLEEALALNPNNYDCVLSLARLLVSRKDPLAAIQRYKQALSLNSSVAQVHYELGNVYMGQAEFDMAIKSFKASLRLMPHNRDEVLANIGTCYMKKGDFDKAKFFFKQSLEVNPDNAGVKSYMASVTAATTPSISPGAGGKPFQAGQAGGQTAPHRPAPTGQTPLKFPAVRLEGSYTLEGIYPNGAKYNGTALISEYGGSYAVTWKVGDHTFTGTGALLSEKVLTVHRKGPKAVNGLIVYQMEANGMLKGVWGNGKGGETLKPIR